MLYALSLFGETVKTVKAVGEGRAFVTLALVKLAKAGALRSLDEILADLDELRERIGSGGPPGAAPVSSGRAAKPLPAARAAAPPGDRALFENPGLPAEGALAGEETVKLTLSRVESAWSGILDHVAAASSAAASFLRAGRPIGMTDETVTVGFAPEVRFQKSQLDDPDRIRLVELAIEERLGTRLRLVTEVTEAAREEPGSYIPHFQDRPQLNLCCFTVASYVSPWQG